jgi:hypothetical protein
MATMPTRRRVSRGGVEEEVALAALALAAAAAAAAVPSLLTSEACCFCFGVGDQEECERVAQV